MAIGKFNEISDSTEKNETLDEFDLYKNFEDGEQDKDELKGERPYKNQILETPDDNDDLDEEDGDNDNLDNFDDSDMGDDGGDDSEDMDDAQELDNSERERGFERNSIEEVKNKEDGNAVEQKRGGFNQAFNNFIKKFERVDEKKETPESEERGENIEDKKSQPEKNSFQERRNSFMESYKVNPEDMQKNKEETERIDKTLQRESGGMTPGGNAYERRFGYSIDDE